MLANAFRTLGRTCERAGRDARIKPKLHPISLLCFFLQGSHYILDIIVGEIHAPTITSELVRFANRDLLSTATGREITLDADTPILDLGILDSLSMVSLLSFVQNTLGVVIPDGMVLPEHFETLGMLGDLIGRLQSNGSAASEGQAESVLLQSVKFLESAGLSRRWFRESAGSHLHALEVSGAEPRWVLIPGLGNPSSSWGTVLKALRDENAAIAVDLPGFGISRSGQVAPCYEEQVRAVREAILEGGGERFVLVGSSAGSLIAAEIARQLPDAVVALVITGFGLVEDPPAWRDMLYRLSTAPEEFLNFAYHRPPKLTETVRTLIHDVMSRPAYRAFLDGKGLEAMSSAFDDLRVPTLFVAGLEDRIIPPAAVSAAAARIPGARVEWLARCGHFPPAEQPEELVYYIRDFLKGLN
jgi:2-hydroxymuconate-semialdehyde hydrolase